MHFRRRIIKDKLLIGWNEWCQLPDLNLSAVKAKIDTGAKTSAIHAFDIKPIRMKGKKFVRFSVHPLQGNNDVIVRCKAPVVDERNVMSSNGHKEHRIVIKTPLILGNQTWDIELTLSNRDPLKFRMLLGREALNGRVIIDPIHTTRQGKIKKDALKKMYAVKKT